MNIYRDEFSKYLTRLLEDLNRYSPNDICQKYIESFNKLDIEKVIDTYLNFINGYGDLIKDRDVIVFDKPFVMLPELDISLYWNNLTSKQQRKIWVYINILKHKAELSKDYNIEHEFDPFKGVGPSTDAEYSIDNMFSGPKTMPGEEEVEVMDPGIMSAIKTLGIDKQLGDNIGDFGNLLGDLKNMNKEDLDEAIKKIQEQFGLKLEGETAELFNNILHSMSSEISNSDFSQGNLFENLTTIAGNIANKIAPEITDNEEIIEKIQNTNLMDIFSNVTGQDPNNPQNPMNMLNNFMSGLGQGNNPTDMLNNMMSSMGREGENPMNILNEFMNSATNPQDTNNNSDTRK